MPVSDPDKAFGVYVHWPFCLSKCPYCDFNSHVRDNIDQSRWADALVREIEHFAARLQGQTAEQRTVSSIFFGGGTPSLMSPQTVASVLGAIRTQWSLASDVEITAEANPTSVEAASFEAFARAGVNRLSLGVQALDDAALGFLGRTHGVDEALDALALAQKVFPRVSLDLIYARPGQTADAWGSELRRALDLGAEHLSLYQLTIEPGTGFQGAVARGAFAPMDDDAAADLYEQTQRICEGAGMPAYEISNHALPGSEARHNLLYWRYGEYLGIGPGAHGRIREDGALYAHQQRRKPEAWLSQVEAAGQGGELAELVESQRRAQEFVMMGLRLREGISLERLARVSGRPIAQCLNEDRLALLGREGLVQVSQDRLCVSERGRPVLNAIIAELMADLPETPETQEGRSASAAAGSV